MTVSVRLATSRDEQAWEAFVATHSQATFFHRFAWSRVLSKAFGHKPYFFLAERDQKVVGLLPLVEVRSRLFGHQLASLPFCVYGGVVATDGETEHALREAAATLGLRLKVDAVELRNREPSGSDWAVKDLYYTFRKELHADNDLNLKGIPNRQRAMVRKGIAEGLESIEVEGTERLYRVYAESLRNLGTPVFSRRYLEVLREEFGDACRVLMIQQGGEDVAGVLSFYFRREVLPYYGGSVSRARSIRGCNHFMYWELMRRSADEGLELFDFGRSKKETGPFDFKKNMGFAPEPLPYEYYLVKSDAIPEVNPANPKYRLMIDMWKRLPLPVANLLGPPLARNLG